MNSIVCVCFLAVASFVAVAYGEESCPSNDVATVRSKLQECVALLPSGFRGMPDYMTEFGLPRSVKVKERELGLIVSNCLDAVYSSFEVVATNEIERRLILASPWSVSDDFYLNCLSRNIDLAASGKISLGDLSWYMEGHRSRRLTYLLDAQYDQPGVSNVVLRQMALTGDTNKYARVLSGEAKLEYIEFEQFMSEGPESQTQEE